MNKILQRVILFAVTISIAVMAAAATVPNVLSQLPYSYGLGNFPAYQINQNEAYTLYWTVRGTSRQRHGQSLPRPAWRLWAAITRSTRLRRRSP